MSYVFEALEGSQGWAGQAMEWCHAVKMVRLAAASSKVNIGELVRIYRK